MKNTLKFIIIVFLLFSCNKDKEYKEYNIEVIISFDIDNVETDKDILFSDMSSIEPTYRKWTFEGGKPNISSEKTQIVTFDQPGYYRITLEDFFESIDRTILKTTYITVLGGEVEANFEVNRNEILEEQSVTFTDTSIGFQTNRKWIFEGGEPQYSTEKSPVITYNNSGVYDVSLFIENDSHQDSVIKVGEIIVKKPNFNEGLVAFYPFKTNARDESDYSNHGQVEGPHLASDRYGNYNLCYSFDGNNDIIQINDNPQLYLNREFTISAWIYPRSIKSQEILKKGGCTVNGPYKWPWGLALSQSNDMIFTITTENGNNFYQARKHGYEIDKWYLVTGVLKDQTMYLYINGNLEATKSIEGDIVNDPYSLYIGTRLQLPSSTFYGKIDDIRIYNRSLSDAEVAYLYEKIY